MRRTGRPSAAQAGERCALNLAGDGITKDAIARGDMVLDPDSACADRPDRCDASAARDRDKTGQPMDAGASASCGGRCRRAHRAAWRRTDPARRRRHWFSSCSTGRSRRRPATALCCAIRRRSARSAAEDSSICARPRASAARRSGSRSSPRTRSPIRKRRWRRLLDSSAALCRSLGVRARPRARRRAMSRRLVERCNAVKLPTANATLALSAAHWLQPQARACWRRWRDSTPKIRICRASGSSGCACSFSRACRRPDFCRFCKALTKTGRDCARRRLGAPVGPRGAAHARRTKSSGAGSRRCCGGRTISSAARARHRRSARACVSPMCGGC